jgi:hypothetical protein
MDKKDKKLALMQEYGDQYTVICVGAFQNYGATEKCKFCPRGLEKVYYYFQCIKKDQSKNVVTFYTGPTCGRDFASVCQIK